MSASEKLKALDAELLHVRPWGDPMWNLRAALPQIVALTEWAERTIQNFDEYGEVSFIPLIDSLEELDKALS